VVNPHAANFSRKRCLAANPKGHALAKLEWFSELRLGRADSLAHFVVNGHVSKLDDNWRAHVFEGNGQAISDWWIYVNRDVIRGEQRHCETEEEHCGNRGANNEFHGGFLLGVGDLGQAF